MAAIRYVSEPGTFLVKRPANGSNASGHRQLLLGGRMHIDETSIEDGWVMASTIPDVNGRIAQGFVELDRLSDREQLKIFYPVFCKVLNAVIRAPQIAHS